MTLNPNQFARPAFNYTSRANPVSRPALHYTSTDRVTKPAFDPDEHMQLVEATIGLDRFWELKQAAELGVRTNDAFWQARIDALAGRVLTEGER